MKEIKHIAFHGRACCDELNDFNLVYYIHQSNCHSCIIKIFNYYGTKYGLYPSQIEDDIKREFKRIELDKFKESFEELLK
jgi:hypothetical protein